MPSSYSMSRSGFSKALTLMEVLVSVTIFSFLSVALYLLLRSGLVVRQRIGGYQANTQNLYLRLDVMDQELRNICVFRKDQDTPILKGSETGIDFCTVSFDYAAQHPTIYKIIYECKDNTLFKTRQHPINEEETATVEFIDNLESCSFFYFDGEERKWQGIWDNADAVPQGIRIDVVRKDKQGRETPMSKYVFLYANAFKDDEQGGTKAEDEEAEPQKSEEKE